VEETLNGLLEAEADAICGATRYERSPERLHAGGALHAEAVDLGRRGRAAGAAVAEAAV